MMTTYFKYILAFLMLFMNRHAFAEGLSTIKAIACAPALYKALDKWETPKDWVRDGDDSNGVKRLRAATTKKDVYLTLTLAPDYTEAIRKSNKDAIVLRWDTRRQCTPAMQIQDLTKAATKNIFTDADLETILDNSLKKKSTGLIYVWSPHMNYSVQGVGEAQKLLRSMHHDLVVLLDPYADLDGAKAVAKANGFPESALKRLEADSLFRRNMLDHFPSFIVYSKGHLAAAARLGHDTPARLKAFIKEAEAAK